MTENAKFVACVACDQVHLDGEGHNFLPELLRALGKSLAPALQGLGACEACPPAKVLRHYELRCELSRN